MKWVTSLLMWGVGWSAIILTSATVARAQEQTLEEKEPANYAFATYMGSGLYGATDASLFVLNIPMTFQWRDREDIRIRFSTSAGFFDYGRDNLQELEIPDSIGTLTLIPGVEKVYTVNHRWELIPHIDYGYAKNFSTKEDAQVYSTGLHTRYYTQGDMARHVWVNKVLLAGYRTFASDQRDNYVKLLTGFDYKSNVYLSLKAGIAVPTVYGSISWSYNGIDYAEKLKGGTAHDLHYEVGVSLYAPKPIDLWITEVNRVGLGIQHNPFGTVLRLFAGTPF